MSQPQSPPQGHAPGNAQERLLRAFTVLRLLRPDWGGSLILSCGLTDEGASLALAANLAGAVCLSIEEHPDILKQALRSGSCDFIVNTLDEALRTIKNEIRKQQPIAVGLRGKPTAILAEVLERGLQPDVFSDFTAGPAEPGSMLLYRQSIRQLQDRGATLVEFGASLPVLGVTDARALLGSFIVDRGWTLHSFSIKDSTSMKAFEAYAGSVVAEDDLIRRPWLQSASRLLPRERPLRRVLWVSEAERDLLERVFPPIVA